MAEIPERGREILAKKSIGNLATLMPDGSPHVTPVWVDLDGDDIIVNTKEGRLKPRNLRRDPRVAISVRDPDAIVALIVRGTAELTREGAREHADRLARKYLDSDFWPYEEPGDVRVLIGSTPSGSSSTPPSRRPAYAGTGASGRRSSADSMSASENSRSSSRPAR